MDSVFLRENRGHLSENLSTKNYSFGAKMRIIRRLPPNGSHPLRIPRNTRAQVKLAKSLAWPKEWGPCCVAFGSAPHSHCGGRGFESLRVHQKYRGLPCGRASVFLYTIRGIRTRGLLETCRGHVSTRGGLPRRAGRIPSSPPQRRSKLHIACSDFLCLWQKSQSALIPLLLLSQTATTCVGLQFGDTRIKLYFAVLIS